ncbi:MAG: hypothetical protein ACFFC6_02505 [Promethearchaeota archaeon]
MGQDDKLQVIMVDEPKHQTYRTQLIQKIKHRFHRVSNLIETAPLLQGTTLQIYWYLLTHPQGMAGIREIQRALNQSSSGSVSYHINKLIENGIVTKNEESDKYYVKTEVKSGVLGFYFRFGHHVVPRFTFYLVIFILATICFIIFLLTRGDAYISDPSNWVFLFILIFGILIFVYESLKIWSIKP